MEARHKERMSWLDKDAAELFLKVTFSVLDDDAANSVTDTDI